MLYLLTPPSALLWNSMPEETLEIAKRHDRDLGQLDWDVVEDQHHAPTAIRVALRHGVACSRGIAFPAWILRKAERPQALAQQTDKLLKMNAQIAASNDGLMEAAIPGWTKNSQEQDQKLVESMQKTIAEAQEDADQLLTAPEIPHLVTAWERMGGVTA